MSTQSKTYEANYAVLERITESLNKDEVGIDDLVEKTREALNAARVCMEILNKQKGDFKKLETEFSQLLQNSAETATEAETEPETPPEENVPTEDNIGEDTPF